MSENDIHFVAGFMAALFTVGCLWLFSRTQDR